MDSWQRLEVGLPLLGRTMRCFESWTSSRRRTAPAANHVRSADAPAWTVVAPTGSEARRIGGGVRLAEHADELAALVAAAERDVPS